MEYIQIGTIVNTFGLKGELRIISNSEFISDRFAVGNKIWVFIDTYLPLTIDGFRMHKGNALITFAEMHDINLVANLKSLPVFMHMDDIPALKDGYYLFQLYGLDVYFNNKKIGEVIEVMKPAGQSLLRIQTEVKTVLIPFVPAFIKAVDLGKRRIDVDVIEGLL